MQGVYMCQGCNASSESCSCSSSDSSSCSCSSSRPYSGPSQMYRCHTPCPPPIKPCYDPGISHFTSVIVPTMNLMPQFSNATGTVEFLMRRKNKVVTMQWEGFSAVMGAGGVAYLTATQSISNLPPYAVYFPLAIQYKGTIKMTYMVVDPHMKGGNIRFYLNSDGSSTGINMGDAFTIYAGSAVWIVE